MATPRIPQQRLEPADSSASYVGDGDGHVQRLLDLSDAARAFTDGFCGQARLMAAKQGEQLWRELLARAGPQDDVGPALLLAISLDARGAADEARQIIEGVLRPGTYGRWALELAVELAQDAGEAARAWELLRQLGADTRLVRYGTLQCVVFCTPDRGCAAARRPGIVRSRWLWQRARDWVSAPSSELHLGDAERQLLLAEGGPLADVVREDGRVRGIGPMSQGLFAYLRRRWTLLSETERELGLRWLRTRRRPYSVVDVHQHEMVLVDAYGRHHLAGAEADCVDRRWRPDDMISGWLLPTSVPDEHLLILDTAPVPSSS